MLKIALLRHGRARQTDETPVSANGFASWIENYNRSGIAGNSTPSETVLEFSRTCGLIACSNLSRSIQSAELLIEDKQLKSDRSYAEAGMPQAEWRLIKLAPKYWAILFRVGWYAGYSHNSESYTDAKDRASIAAQKLIDIANTHQSVLLVGHGIFNRLLAKELRTLGWSGPRNPGSKYWDCAIYTKDT